MRACSLGSLQHVLSSIPKGDTYGLVIPYPSYLCGFGQHVVGCILGILLFVFVIGG